MGATESHALQGRSFNEQQWQSLPVSCFTKLKDPYYGSNFKVLVNKLNRAVEVEQYSLVFNSEGEFRAYRELIDWRTSCRYLVASKYIQSLKDTGLCSNFHYASVFFERMPLRLYEIQDISLEEGLYIIYAASQGFEKLYEKFGFFDIESEMVCFSKDGLVRVWANKNLSKAFPEAGSLGRKKDYEEFIAKLLAIVEKLIDFEGKLTISEFIGRKRVKNALENLLGTLEQYIKQVGVTIPRFLASIRSLCSGKKPKKGKEARKGLNSSYVLSNKSSLSRNHEKSLEINNTLYNIAINTPARRSHELQHSELTTRKRPSFVVPSRPSKPQVSFQYRAHPESPKNYSYSTQEDVFRKSKIYSTIDLAQKEPLPANLEVLEQFQIDPEIAADMLRIAESP